MATGFKAARNSAYNMSWDVLAEMSADKELSDADTLITLRRRSKQLTKDSAIVAGVQQAILNIVGTPNSFIVDSTSNVQAKQAQEVVDEAMEDCTIDNKTIHKAIEEIVACSVTDGDILVSLPIDRKRKGTKTVLELIEAQRVRTPTEEIRNDKVRNGVKYDDEGRVLGYYVKKSDKIDRYGDTKKNYDFYPRVRTSNGVSRVVTRLFKSPLNSRPTGSRQYPLITPVIPLLKQMDDYLEAVIVGARVAACFAAFVTSNNPAGAFGGFTTDADGTVTDPQDADETRRVSKLFPGMVAYLKQNESITFASPNRPNDNVDAFLVRLAKTAAMYLRIPYEILFLDLTESNYSSWKGASNELKKLTQRWRRELNDIIGWYLQTVVLENIVYGRIRGDINQITIKKRWPSHGLLDPEKEARANGLALKNGTTSPQRICEEEGNSYEEVQAELLEDELNAVERRAEVLKRMKELEEKYGIEFQIEGKTEEREREKRPGEGDELDEDEKKERRKEDGNW